MALNVLYTKGDTATINSTAKQEGQILFNTQTGEQFLDNNSTTRIPLVTPTDTAMSTTSTNPIQNQALTNLIPDTLASALAITDNHVPCGTKAVKELYDSHIIPTKKTIIWNNVPITSLCYKIGNLVHIDFKMVYTLGISNGNEIVGTVPSDCIPSSTVIYTAIGHANRSSSATYADNFGMLGSVDSTGKIFIANEFGIEMFGACLCMDYFIN